nr:hypothetical protein B0A51_07868 [Rachicladosporium sp. CCFEE 5018]
MTMRLALRSVILSAYTTASSHMASTMEDIDYENIDIENSLPDLVGDTTSIGTQSELVDTDPEPVMPATETTHSEGASSQQAAKLRAIIAVGREWALPHAEQSDLIKSFKQDGRFQGMNVTELKEYLDELEAQAVVLEMDAELGLPPLREIGYASAHARSHNAFTRPRPHLPKMLVKEIEQALLVSTVSTLGLFFDSEHSIAGQAGQLSRIAVRMDTANSSLALIKLRRTAMLEREAIRAAATASAAPLPAPPLPLPSTQRISAQGSNQTRLNLPPSRASAAPYRHHPSLTPAASTRPAEVPASSANVPQAAGPSGNPTPVTVPSTDTVENGETAADIQTIPIHLRRVKAGLPPFRRAVDVDNVKWRPGDFGTSKSTTPAMRLVKKGHYWMPYDWKNALEYGMFVETARAWIEAEYKDHAAINERAHDSMATLIRHVRRIIASTRKELFPYLTGGNLSRAMFLKEQPVFDIVQNLTRLSKTLPSIYLMEMVRKRDCQGMKPDELRRIIEVAREYTRARRSDNAQNAFDEYALKKDDELRAIELHAFLDALEAMLEDMPASEHDQPLVMCMRETGYAKKGIYRIKQHEKGRSTNAMMLLFTCIANVIFPDRFMIKGHVIYIIWDEEQGMVAEPFFSSINSAYTRTGRGFSWWPAGLFANTKSLRDEPWAWGAWAEQEIVAETPILDRLREDNEAMKTFMAAAHGGGQQILSVDNEEQIQARGEDALWLKGQDAIADSVLLSQNSIEDTIQMINSALDQQMDLRQALAGGDDSRSERLVQEIRKKLNADLAGYSHVGAADAQAEGSDEEHLSSPSAASSAYTESELQAEIQPPVEGITSDNDIGAEGDFKDDISEVDEAYGDGGNQTELRTSANDANIGLDSDDNWASYVAATTLSGTDDDPPTTMFDLPTPLVSHSGKGKARQYVPSLSPLPSAYTFKGIQRPAMSQQSFSQYMDDEVATKNDAALAEGVRQSRLSASSKPSSSQAAAASQSSVPSMSRPPLGLQNARRASSRGGQTTSATSGARSQSSTLPSPTMPPPSRPHLPRPVSPHRLGLSGMSGLGGMRRESGTTYSTAMFSSMARTTDPATRRPSSASHGDGAGHGEGDVGDEDHAAQELREMELEEARMRSAQAPNLADDEMEEEVTEQQFNASYSDSQAQESSDVESSEADDADEGACGR